MKKTNLLLLFLFLSGFVYSQNDTIVKQNKSIDSLKNVENRKVLTIKKIPEPEWENEAVYLDNDNSIPLENKTAHLKSSASASMYIIGVGNIKAKYVVKGNKSTIRINKKNNLVFIINTGNNTFNPRKIIQIIKLKTNKKRKRYFIAAKSETFSGSEVGDYETVSFVAKKYGKNSYMIKIPKIESGEYAIIINQGNMWNLFGID